MELLSPITMRENPEAKPCVNPICQLFLFDKENNQIGWPLNATINTVNIEVSLVSMHICATVCQEDYLYNDPSKANMINYCSGCAHFFRLFTVFVFIAMFIICILLTTISM